MKAVKLTTGKDTGRKPLTRTILMNDDGDNIKCPHGFGNERTQVTCSDKCAFWHLSHKCGFGQMIEQGLIKVDG